MGNIRVKIFIGLFALLTETPANTVKKDCPLDECRIGKSRVQISLTEAGFKTILGIIGSRKLIVFESVCRMKAKYTSFALLVSFLVLAMTSGSVAVNTRAIDKVLNKGVLDRKDLQIIDNFVGEAVQELVNTKDFTSVARIRMAISSRYKSNQAQYAQQFSESAHKYISKALQETSKLTPQGHKLKVMVNLLILVDSLKDVRLAELVIGLLKDENAVIRYWAVHTITNPAIAKQLNSTKSTKLAKNITEKLKDAAEGTGSEILAQVAEFAAKLNTQDGEGLLLHIADLRISKYADWTVENELLDATILKLLYSKMSSASANKLATAQRFAQLYSYAMQRYINGRKFLSAEQKHQLASVLAEVEKSCISKKPVDMPQSTIRKAVGQKDYTTLLLEHSRLLGDETSPGQLASKLKFDYGENSDGTKRTAPLTLPEPPKTEAVETDN